MRQNRSVQAGAGCKHVSLVAIPEGLSSPINGLYEILHSFKVLGTFEDAVPTEPPFHAEILVPGGLTTTTASGLPIQAHRTLEEVEHTDIIVLPSLLVEGGDWRCGRYPSLVDWMRRMHKRGAMLCSACSGVLLLAETGLLDGRDATIHWAYARTFTENFPTVRLRLEKVLVAAGDRNEFIMSGASASWHDLALYLIARWVCPSAAQAVARFMLLQWHQDGQAPYLTFSAPLDHGDAVVLRLQEWLQQHYAVANPVEEMARQSGLPERSFKRRFVKATGYAPVTYVQHLRIEEGKRRLERTDDPIDEISWAVGYEDPAFFRRLFKRVTQITPGSYRRKFQVPEI